MVLRSMQELLGACVEKSPELDLQKEGAGECEEGSGKHVLLNEKKRKLATVLNA